MGVGWVGRTLNTSEKADTGMCAGLQSWAAGEAWSVILQSGAS